MKRMCEVEGCEKKVSGYGICENHLKRWKRGTFDPVGLSLTPRKATSPEQVWEKYVDKTGDCWVWTGAIDTKGYGVTRPHGALLRAHRWAYEQVVGPIPDGMDLDHECHNRDEDCTGGGSCAHRRCVNPSHLKPKTRKENLNGGNGAGGDKWKALEGR